MSRGLVISIVFCLLYGCGGKIKNEVKVVPSVKCFSAIMFRSHDDTVRHYFVRTYLFKEDSVFALKPDSVDHWNVRATHLSSRKLDSINQIIRLIDFKSSEVSGRGENKVAYCLPMFGFIDSLEKIKIFVPFGKEETMNSLLMMLDGNDVPTNDTSEIIDYTVRIKRKYLQLFPRPVLQEVKFVPSANE